MLITPMSVEKRPGSFTFPRSFTIGSIHAEDSLPARLLIDELNAVGAMGRATTETAHATIVMRRVQRPCSHEGYDLRIERDSILLTASSATGVYYGVQTLRELVRQYGVTIPALFITDRPEFARRGFYLDCSRGKVPKLDTVLRLIELLAHWKVNELQLYIENVFRFARHPAIGEGYAPFHPSDIRAIQQHAQLHHIRLVPSLASLGHLEKILMLREYRDLGELPGYADLPGGTTLNTQDPRALSLVKDMYDEFLPLFAAKDFNACGDEPWELGRGRSKERAESVGVGRIYLDFVRELRKLAVSQGKRLNIWGDIVLKYPEIIPELPKDLVLLNWDYTPDGKMMSRTNEFAEAGLPLVCCPGTNGWQSHGTRLEMSMRNVHQFAGIAKKYGAEGILNTDWGDYGHRNTLGVSLHGIAYAAACSWNHSGTPPPGSDEFTRAFASQLFGDSDESRVPWLQTVGDDEFGYWAYHALLESLREEQAFGRGFSRGKPTINEVPLDDQQLREKIEAADALEAQHASLQERSERSTDSGDDSFLKVAIDEYKVANRMNRAAARRVLLARRVRTGHSPDDRQLSAHRNEMSSLRADLERVWLKRNRRSRLDDSLAGFDQAVEELDEMRESD